MTIVSVVRSDRTAGLQCSWCHARIVRCWRVAALAENPQGFTKRSQLAAGLPSENGLSDEIRTRKSTRVTTWRSTN